MKNVIFSEKAPKAIGPYSQAIKSGNVIYTSGQLGLDETGGFAGLDAVTQTRQSLKNLKAILESVGAGMDDVVKTMIFLADMNDFADVNKIYEECFTSPYPARTCVQVVKLPKDGKVEIEVVAVTK